MNQALVIFVISLLSATLARSADTTCNLSFSLADFALRPTATQRITLTPLQPLGSYGSQILSPTPLSQSTSASGQTTFSNIVSGYAYRVQISPAGTTFTNVITTGVTGTVNAHDYIGNFAGQFFQYYYTSNLLAASFDPLGAAQQATNTIAAPAIIGLVTSNQIATINPSQIYPAVTVAAGGQTNWSVGAVTNAGILYNGTTYAFVTNNNGGALTNLNIAASGGVTNVDNFTYTNVILQGNSSFNAKNVTTTKIVSSGGFNLSGENLPGSGTLASGIIYLGGDSTNGSTVTVNSSKSFEFDVWNYAASTRYSLLNGSAPSLGYNKILIGGSTLGTLAPNYISFSTTNGSWVIDSFNTAGNDVGALIPSAKQNIGKQNQPAGTVYATNFTATAIGTGFTGDGFGLTNISGSSVSGASTITNGLATTNFVLGQSFVTASAANAFTNVGNTFVGTHTGNGAGLTNLSLPYTSITNSPWITTNAFTSLISSSNFVKATVTNGLTTATNNFYGTFSSTSVVNKITTNSTITTNITVNSIAVSGITNVPASPYDTNQSHYNGTYSWNGAIGSQGAWVKGTTNVFGYSGASQGGTFAGMIFSTNYAVFDNSTYAQVIDGNSQWGVQFGTTSLGRYFTGLVSPVVVLFQDYNTFQNVTFTLSSTTTYTTNFTYITNYFNNVLNGAGIALAAASGNTNLLISNNDPWFTTDNNPTLDVSGSVDQALVVKGSFYVTGTLNGNGGGLTNISGASGGGATNLLNVRLYPYTQATNISISLPSSATNISQLTYAILATNNIYFVQPSNLVAGFNFLIDWRQDSTGGRTATWNTNFWKFPSAQILTMTTNANSESLISCVVGQYATNIFVIQSLNFQ
jgi:hypothetical protein